MTMLLDAIGMLARYLLPFLLIVLILTIINIILNYIKFGTKIFSSFKKYNLNGTMKNLVIDIFKNENHKNVLIINVDENYFYGISNYQVFAIFIFDSLVKNTDDNELLKDKISKFISDNKKIIESGVYLETVYINTKKDVKLDIDNISDKVYSLKEFSYNLYPNQHSTIKYSKEDMIKLKKQIEDVLNGNN